MHFCVMKANRSPYGLTEAEGPAGGMFLDFQETGWMVPRWLPAKEHWPLGASLGSILGAPPPSAWPTQLAESVGPGLEMLSNRLRGWSQRAAC